MEDIDDTPSLELADWTSGHDAHLVANVTDIVFVMSVYGGLSFDFLAIQRVWNLVIEGHFDGLVPRVVGHHSDQFLSVVAFTHLH